MKKFIILLALAGFLQSANAQAECPIHVGDMFQNPITGQCVAVLAVAKNCFVIVQGMEQSGWISPSTVLSFPQCGE